MLGRYENFPEGIHRIEHFTSALPSKKLQQKAHKKKSAKEEAKRFQK
jgi:hypothetical protein